MSVNSALFLDYDNVFITLQKFSTDLAARFASKPQVWVKAIEQTLGLSEDDQGPARRLLMRRCYASPDNIYRSRYSFTQAGLEVIDCPPLTRRMKNGADISIVVDIMDSLERYPHIDEYVILSADADFVPVLHRLRKEMKLSVIFTSFDTASAYRNCADLTLDAEFFRKHLEAEMESARRPAAPQPAASSAAPQAELSADAWAKIATTLRKTALKRLGELPFAAAAQDLRSELPEILGDNWAGFGRFTDLMSKAPASVLEGLETNLEAQEYRLTDFRLDLSSWGQDGEGDMVSFVTDVLNLQKRRIPFLSPSTYTKIFSALAQAFAEGAESLTNAVDAAMEICKGEGVEVSSNELRFICVGVSSQGCTLDNTSSAQDFTSAWRINVWELCDGPEWMREPDEAEMLATWFHADGETPAQGGAEFIELTSQDGPGDASMGEGAA